MKPSDFLKVYKASARLYFIVHENDILDILHHYGIKVSKKALINDMQKRVGKNTVDYCIDKSEKLYHCVYLPLPDKKTTKFIIDNQRDKPLYLPDTFDDFLKFADYQYLDETESVYQRKLANFISKNCNVNKKLALEFAQVLMMQMRMDDIQSVFQKIEKLKLQSSNENYLQEFLNLVADTFNNVRMPSNNGFTPTELRNLHGPIDPSNVELTIGPNIRERLLSGEIDIYGLYKEIDENNEMPLMMKESLKSQLKEIINEMVNIPKA